MAFSTTTKKASRIQCKSAESCLETACSCGEKAHLFFKGIVHLYMTFCHLIHTTLWIRTLVAFSNPGSYSGVSWNVRLQTGVHWNVKQQKKKNTSLWRSCGVIPVSGRYSSPISVFSQNIRCCLLTGTMCTLHGRDQPLMFSRCEFSLCRIPAMKRCRALTWIRKCHQSPNPQNSE